MKFMRSVSFFFGLMYQFHISRCISSRSGSLLIWLRSQIKQTQTTCSLSFNPGMSRKKIKSLNSQICFFRSSSGLNIKEMRIEADPNDFK